MKKTIIATTLRVIPKKLQDKALCKALNYLFSKEDMAELQGAIIKLCISDIKKSWFITYGDHGFEGTHLRKVNLEIKTNLNVAMVLGDKAVIIDALKQGELELVGEDVLVHSMGQYLYSLNEHRLDNLSSQLFSFFNIKAKSSPRLDINQVQFADLKSKIDVDFIRDEALRLERTDLKKALFLMELAHQSRPNGPLIIKKVAEYRTRLKIQLV